MALASSSTSSAAKQCLMPMNYHTYPPPLARYEDVVASPKLFMDTLGKLHYSMGTKFMIPIIGGRDLDLHRLFVEVTSRGGIGRVLNEKRWKEVTATFSFPSSATNASFILRKYYVSLLQHYEQIYYFKAKDSLQNVSMALASNHGKNESILSSTIVQDAPIQPQINIAKSIHGATPAITTGSSLEGVIDGKFESGYLVTVTIGSEKLKGVLYQTPQNKVDQTKQNQSVVPKIGEKVATRTGVVRRRRRKKCEMKKRDPAHPKPNRSGYNFFFAEQHARLKPLYPGKDRDISRMIGELWNNLNDIGKEVYKEKAARDKERYRIEMADYRERLKTGQVIGHALPIQQQPPPGADVNMIEVDEKIEGEGVESPQTPENELSSEKSDGSNFEDKNIDMEKSIGIDTEAKSVGVAETLVYEKALELQKGVVKNAKDSEECPKADQMESQKETLHIDENESAQLKGKECEVRLEKEAVPGEGKEAVPL